MQFIFYVYIWCACTFFSTRNSLVTKVFCLITEQTKQIEITSLNLKIKIFHTRGSHDIQIIKYTIMILQRKINRFLTKVSISYSWGHTLTKKYYISWLCDWCCLHPLISIHINFLLSIISVIQYVIFQKTFILHHIQFITERKHFLEDGR